MPQDLTRRLSRQGYSAARRNDKHTAAAAKVLSSPEYRMLRQTLVRA